MYAIWMSISSGVGEDVVLSSAAGFVLTIIPSNSSFGEYFKLGSIQLLMHLMVASRWSGQLLGMSFSTYSSSPKSGAHILFSCFRSMPLVPSNRLLTHGEYAGQV